MPRGLPSGSVLRRGRGRTDRQRDCRSRSISAVGPCQMMRPLCSIAIRSAILRALTMSWVIEIAVAPSSRTRSMISWLITSAMIGSSPVVGSSKNMISGSAAIARASATRFCMPPDSSEGLNAPTSGPSPTEASFSSATSRASCRGHATPLDQPERDILPYTQQIEQGAALEQHAEAAASASCAPRVRSRQSRPRRCESTRPPGASARGCI